MNLFFISSGFEFYVSADCNGHLGNRYTSFENAALLCQNVQQCMALCHVVCDVFAPTLS